MPNSAGLAAISPPATPLLAGRPTRSSHSPEKSYIPQVAMMLSAHSVTPSPTTSIAGHGIHAAVGERRGHHREVRRRDGDRALAAVHVDRLLDVRAQRPRARHQVGERTVAARRSRARTRRRPRRPSARARRTPTGTAGSASKRSSGSAPRTSDVVSSAPALTIGFGGRPVLGLEPDRVERLAARLDADALEDLIRAEVVERERVDERLGDRLDRELDAAVADAVAWPSMLTSAIPNCSGSASASSGM